MTLTPSERTKKWRLENPEKAKAHALQRNKRAAAKRRAWRDSVRGDRCEVCGSTERALEVDHDHSCATRACEKCYRGTLCGPCNRALGLLQEDSRIVEAAAQYLRRWENEQLRIVRM